jgi:hypothetical protein
MQKECPRISGMKQAFKLFFCFRQVNLSAQQEKQQLAFIELSGKFTNAGSTYKIQRPQSSLK